MALRMVIGVQKVLGHVLTRRFRGAGSGGPCVGMRGSWLVGAARRPGCCQDVPAESARSAIGGGPRLRRWAYLSCGNPLALPRGRSAAGPRWASLPGGGRLLRRRARWGGGGGLRAGGGTVAHTVDGRRQAAWRGRYRTQGSADYRTHRHACAWARKVRYPWFSPPWKASATPSAPSSHMKRSAR